MTAKNIIRRYCLLLLLLSASWTTWAQPHLAYHELLPGTTLLSGHIGDTHWDNKGRGLLQTGSIQVLGMSETFCSLLEIDDTGLPLGATLLRQAGAGPEASWAGGVVARGTETGIFLATNQFDSAKCDGLLVRLSDGMTVEWSKRWPGVCIRDIVVEEDGQVVCLGEGKDMYGNPDMKLLRFDPANPEAVGRSWGNSDGDGATRILDLPGAGEYLVVGWQQHLDSRLPMVARFTGTYDMLWFQTYMMTLPVLEVTDAAMIQGRIAITGTALDASEIDTLAFMLLLDESGQSEVCRYYQMPDGEPMRGLAIAAYAPLVGEVGFLVGGAWRPSLGFPYERSWLMRTDPEGLPRWARTYYRPGGDSDISESIHSLAYDPEENLFMANGAVGFYESGTLTHLQSSSIKGRAEDGRVKVGMETCTGTLEVTHSDEKVLTYKQGQLWATPGMQVTDVVVQGAAAATGYCAFPVRDAITSIEMAPTLVGSQMLDWYDLQGRLLHQEQLETHAQPRVPAHLPQGLYVMRRYIQGQLVDVQKMLQVP